MNWDRGGSWGRCVMGWSIASLLLVWESGNLLWGHGHSLAARLHGHAIRKETATVYADRVVFFLQERTREMYLLKLSVQIPYKLPSTTGNATRIVKKSGFWDELVLEVQTELHVFVYINGYFIWCPYIPIEDQFVWIEGGWGRNTIFICLQGSYCM